MTLEEVGTLFDKVRDSHKLLNDVASDHRKNVEALSKACDEVFGPDTNLTTVSEQPVSTTSEQKAASWKSVI